jgi:hypothetical protein
VFAFVLCEKLGFAHPRQLLQQLSSVELEEWRAFYELKGREEAQQMAAAKAEQNLRNRRGR